MRKKFISLSLIGIILIGQTGFAFATNELESSNMVCYENQIMPLWTNINSVFTNIKSNGKLITALVNIQPKNKAMYVSGTMYLQQCISGRWINKAKWTFSKNGNVDLLKQYSASSGGRYRVKIEATVNKENLSLLSKEEYVRV